MLVASRKSPTLAAEPRLLRTTLVTSHCRSSKLPLLDRVSDQKSATESEFASAAKSKSLGTIVRFLRQRIRVIEPQRPERRIPN